MTIEVRQLVIKSTVLPEQGSSQPERQVKDDLAAFKEELMTECRELVSECIREHAER